MKAYYYYTQLSRAVLASEQFLTIGLWRATPCTWFAARVSESQHTRTGKGSVTLFNVTPEPYDFCSRTRPSVCAYTVACHAGTWSPPGLPRRYPPRSARAARRPKSANLRYSLLRNAEQRRQVDDRFPCCISCPYFVVALPFGRWSVTGSWGTGRAMYR